jgi:hypothetical protein
VSAVAQPDAHLSGPVGGAAAPLANGTNGYGVGLDLYYRMAELARTLKGQMVISVNDIPEMRQAFAGMRMETVDTQYTGGRSGVRRRGS